jgi:hypothetical protein
MPWRVTKQGAKFCVAKISDGAVVECHDTAEKADAQRRALYASEDYGLRLAIQDFNLEFDRESDVNLPGGSHNLKNYWTHGPGAAKIRWGTDGSFDRCVQHLGKYVKNPQGLCAEYHKAATGEWPAEKGVESGGEMREFADISTDERKRLAKSGDALPDGSYPIRNVADLHNAVSAYGRANPEDRAKVRAHIMKRARELGAAEVIPENWRQANGDTLTAAGGKKSDCGPGQHQMGDGSCMDDDGSATDGYAVGDGDEPWSGVLTVEGVESGDGRLFGLGSLDWEQPPQPLMYQPANVGGHNGSIMVGNITKMTRHGSRIRGEGVVFGSALRSEHGENIRHMMETGGVSVDVDKVKDADVEMVYADDESGDGGNMFAKPETTIFHRGRIRGATLVAFPAFVEAKLAFTNAETLTAACGPEGCGCDDTDPLVAAAHTITIPNLPKAEWFNEPTDVKLSGALTITDEGRIYGILAPGNTTHRSVKRKVPRGNVDYSRFHKAETIVEGGGRVVTGVITAACGHAPTENYGTLERRREHYDNSCSVLANVRIGESKQGYIYAAGALNPGADPRQVAQAFGCALSGDWQPHPDRPGVQEFIAAHLVPVPGFPMARTQASVVYQDGLITASAVPVEHVKAPTYVTGPTYDDTFNAIQMTKRLLVASVGLDPQTRKNQVMKELELI